MKTQFQLVLSELVNKVAQKNIVTIDLEDFYPSPSEVVFFDIKNFLFRELLLKEVNFREDLKQLDWTIYAQKNVVLYCSNQAIVPMWAFMLAAAYLNENNAEIYSNPQRIEEQIVIRKLDQLDIEKYRDQRIIIKGCGDKNISHEVYIHVTKILQPIAKSIMYGEPCSTVPIYKK